MKRYLLNITLFFTIILAIDVAVGGFGDYLQTHAKGGDTKRTNDLVLKDRHDIIVLGSSRAFHHYDTPFLSDTLGLDVYNAGYDGNGIILAYGLLQMILERYQPSLIIYDVEPSFDINVYEPDNHHIRYIHYLKPYYRHRHVGDVIRDVSKEEWNKVHSGMIRYNSCLFSMLKDNYTTSGKTEKGFSPLNGIYTQELKCSEEDISIDDFKIKYLEKLISLAKSKKVPIVFIASPKYGSNSSSQILPAIEICKRNDITFWNYYSDEEFMLHKEWFKEPMHLNAEGAKAFSRKLIHPILEQMSNHNKF